MAAVQDIERLHARASTSKGATVGRVIAFANQKGGVAKTTSTLNLAVAFAEEGKKVLALDLDPQGNLTMSQGLNPDTIERSKVAIANSTFRRVISPSPNAAWKART